MRFAHGAPDVRAALAQDVRLLEQVHTGAMRDLVDGFKGDWREEVLGAGLGNRLANSVRGEVYPKSGASLHPGGYVWTKAPKIMAAHASGATILPTDGRRYLAIPTRHTPMKGRGKRMTPLEVEVAFNQDLVIRRGRKPGHLLAFVNVLAGKSGKGFRPATKGRLAQGRQVKLVLMFVLVPFVRLAKRIDPDARFARWAGSYDQLVQVRWDASPLGRDR